MSLATIEKTIEKQIEDYLSPLSPSQKETVLNVVKTIVNAIQETQEYEDLWEDRDFVKEVERRTAEYENGTARLYKFEDMKNNIIFKYKENNATKK